jgi:hypothetical protein
MTAVLLPSLYIHSILTGRILFCKILGLHGDMSSDLLVFTVLNHTWCCKPAASSVSEKPIVSIYHADETSRFLQNTRTFFHFQTTSHSKWMPYSFAAVQYAMYSNKLKSDLQMGVIIVLYDFGENYAFILQGKA